MYYTADKALSYKPILTMTCRARGYGKTYHWKARSIVRYLKTGEFIALSGAMKYKSRSFANTQVVIFDEFIIDNSTYKNVRYLSQKEPELLVDLLNTIFRMRPVLCVCLANAVTFNNPYFMYYDKRSFVKIAASIESAPP